MPPTASVRTSLLTSLTLAGLLGPPAAARAGSDWIPPRSVQAIVPAATLAPGQTRQLQFLVRANRVPSTVKWKAMPAGAFLCTVSPSQGVLALGADQTAAVSVDVTVPGGLSGSLIGLVYIRLTYEPEGSLAAPDVILSIRAATGGRPEAWPAAVQQTPAGGIDTLVFNVRPTASGSEQFFITGPQRSNPDGINTGMLFPGNTPVTPITLTSGVTSIVKLATRVPGNAFPGNFNTAKLEFLSVSDPLKGTSDATGMVCASIAHPDSLPTALWATGLVPQVQTQSGRDGILPLAGRGLYLQPTGSDGVRVLVDSVLTQVGPVDTDPNGLDDRLVGQIRFPAAVSALNYIPGFVNSQSDVLDLGLVALGTRGLALVDLRAVRDYGIGWEDLWDSDFDFADDRILRRIPIQGFATDVEWFQNPDGRHIALVAAADSGSSPVSAGYNPLLAVAGSGLGVVAVDVTALLDSLPGEPFIVGTLPTPGTTLDLALRGGPNPELAIADGADSVTFWRVHSAGTPPLTGFERLAAVGLSPAWGTAQARDLDWLPANPTTDSTWMVVASGAAGLQLIEAPPAGTPGLALVQRTPSPAIAVAATEWGNVAVAMGSAGSALFKLPRNETLDQIDPLAAAPFTAPVTLDTATPWPAAAPLRAGTHGTVQSSATALRFAPVTVPGAIPNLIVSEGLRTMVLRPGAPLTLVDVPAPTLTWTPGLDLRVVPNPVRQEAEFRVLGDVAFQWQATPGDAVAFEILDLQGRRVRRIAPSSAAGGAGLLARARFDGRDDAGQPLGPGRYWLRASRKGGWSARTSFTLLR